MIRLLARSLFAGAAGALSSTAMLAAAALVEGRGAGQPLNATSHWLHGDSVARRRGIDVAHTGVGLGTHVAATVFWASLFETWMLDRPARDRGEVAARAATVAALAAAVDYTLTPRRFTPGWELVLSKRSMALVYAAMAAGFWATKARASPTGASHEEETRCARPVSLPRLSPCSSPAARCKR